jgi:hypothetical protein
VRCNTGQSVGIKALMIQCRHFARLLLVARISRAPPSALVLKNGRPIHKGTTHLCLSPEYACIHKITCTTKPNNEDLNIADTRRRVSESLQTVAYNNYYSTLSTVCTSLQGFAIYICIITMQMHTLKHLHYRNKMSTCTTIIATIYR